MSMNVAVQVSLLILEDSTLIELAYAGIMVREKLL
jgi:hypothetical protein